MKKAYCWVLPFLLVMPGMCYSQSSLWNVSITPKPLQLNKSMDNMLTSVKKNKPSVALGAGILSFNGDITKGLFSNLTTGYNISVEQGLGRFVSVSVNGLYGKLRGYDAARFPNLNFESKIMQSDFNFLFHLDKPLSPYLSAGIGYLKFDPYGDLKAKNGSNYYYWSNGAIKDKPENDPNKQQAVNLSRDYKYETKLTDSSTNYKRSSLIVPIGLGADMKLLDHFSVRVGVTYYLTFSDWIDNYKAGNSTDGYLYANLSLYYRFSNNSKKEEEDAAFEKIDARDMDNDGIKDLDDKCPGTPSGEKVNEFGCLFDTDNDGIPDVRDKEINSSPGAVIDVDGVTLTDATIAKRHEQFDLLASGKLEKVTESRMTLDSSSLRQINKSSGSHQEIITTVRPEGFVQAKPASQAPVKVSPELKVDSLKRRLLGLEVSRKLDSVNLKQTAAPAVPPIAAQQINTASSGSQKMSEELMYFDKNKDSQISKEEIDAAVNGFFEGDKTITINKINKLINYFFEQ